MNLLKNRKLIALSTAGLVVAGGAGAYAWSVSSIGSGTGTTGTVSSVEFTNDPISNIWAGSTVNVAVAYKSNNAGPVDVTLAPTIGSVTPQPNNTCAKNNFHLNPNTQVLPAVQGTGGVWKPVAGIPGYTPLTVTLDAGAPNGCQNAQVTISYVNP
jgi:hypothetical protein